jgi:hypothetical protein
MKNTRTEEKNKARAEENKETMTEGTGEERTGKEEAKTEENKIN